MTADLWQRYDVKVPRYTSYPTAPHFGPEVTAAAYADWLAALDPAVELSLYFHVPFCAEMCWYCGCYTKIVNRYEPIHAYVDTVLDEVDLVAARLPARMTARHLHWGGGSPSILTGDDWLRMVARIGASLDIAEGAEIALELDPRTTTEGYVRELARAGVNRISIGVQDFDAEVQQAINRDQPFEVTARVVGWLRGHGIDAINMDLMYGLPHQTVARVVDMVDQAVSLDPGRIALFGYAHVPWMKSHQKMIDEAALPGAEDRWRQADAAAERLQELGFVRVGLDHFARPDDELAVAHDQGRLNRNFQGYTTDDASVLIGIGASSIGSLPQGYVQNLSPLRDHARAVADGFLPVARGVALDADDRLRREVIERLMCDLAVDLAQVRARHGAAPDALAEALPALDGMAADGLVEIEDERITVTEAGRPLVRVAAAAFDAYLQQGQARHSRAV